MAQLRIPAATYRLQFNSQFGFRDALAIVPYMRRLDISDIYASPILKARRGSTHGYDVTDPTCLNPELGSDEDFEALVREFQSHGMGLLLDVVPNHMAASSENPWWMDVLEKGRDSPYADLFDIDWEMGNRDWGIGNRESPAPSPQPLAPPRVLLPVLGGPYGQVLENGELELKLEDSGIFVYYYDHKFPLNLKSQAQVSAHRLDALEAKDSAAARQLRGLLDEIAAGSAGAGPDPLKEAFWHDINASQALKAYVLENIALYNGKKGEPRSFDMLDDLLGQQPYRLAFWRLASESINYRRFFDITDLVGVRVELPHVFDTRHTFEMKLVSEGKVTGIRLDHIDGVYDPVGSLHAFQERLASGTSGFYLLVEKILSDDEPLREDWPVFGTTGYDFLNQVNALFVDWDGFQEVKAGYQRFTGLKLPFEDVAYEKKKQALATLFTAELRGLAEELACMALYDRHACDIMPSKLTEALAEATACFPVYSTYIRSAQVSDEDRKYIDQALHEARERCDSLDQRALDFLRRVLLLEFPHDLPAEQKQAWLQFVLSWQQLTGPVMAKGFEDTALYNYNPLISLNDVGGEPGHEKFSIERFHQLNQGRQAKWPHTMNATSTHDTKRSEDVRARINVLSEFSHEWNQRQAQWSQWNRSKKRELNGLAVPDANTETLLYQTMVGAWPLGDNEIPGFRERLKAYMVKASREAKVLTSWLDPSAESEEAITSFVDAILEESPRNEFLSDFKGFQRRIAFYGAINALSQALLKMTCPGLPDIYQGTELWDFSMVDPDNRRPVDYAKRAALLDDLLAHEQRDSASLISGLFDSWQDGRIKLYLTYKALNARNAYSEVFSKGKYVPLRAGGDRAGHIFAFARRHEDTWIAVAVPRLAAALTKEGEFPLGGVWEGETLLLPSDAPRNWRSLFTGDTIETDASTGALSLSRLFQSFPFALLISS